MNTAQFEAMTDELERRREECLQLKAMLAERTITTHSIARESYGGMDSLVNEDNELELAYKTQKDLNRSVEVCVWDIIVFLSWYSSERPQKVNVCLCWRYYSIVVVVSPTRRRKT